MNNNSKLCYKCVMLVITAEALLRSLREPRTAFVHISTAYCNSDQTVIEEFVYPPPVSIEEAYKLAEQEIPGETKTYLKLGRPNTYTVSKALAEHLVSEIHGDIPAVIIRPSIVTPSKEEPVKGWVDNWYGATALLTIIAKGICRVVYTSDDHVFDMIPVDYVCNLTLVAAARAKRQPVVAVYNSCSGTSNPITIKEATQFYMQAGVEAEFNDLPYPSLVCTKRYWLINLITTITYFIAYAADLLLKLSMKKARFTKLVSKSVKIQKLLEFFSVNSWTIKADQSRVLYESLSPNDARLFPFLARDIDWEEYMTRYFQGVTKYLLEKPTH